MLIRRVAVEGGSMEPVLRDGDWLVVTSLGGPPRVGEIVLAHDPRERQRLVLKRVAAADRTTVTLHGDSADHSTDSRTYGPVPLADVVGRAVLRYAPLDRVGWL